MALGISSKKRLNEALIVYQRSPQSWVNEPQVQALRGKTIVLLRSYWHTHLTDEDILRSLMELLGKHAGAQEALECYQRLCERLALEGSTPDERTQKTAQSMSLRQSTDERSLKVRPSLNGESTTSFHLQDGTYTPFSRIVTEDIMKMSKDMDEVNPALIKESGAIVDIPVVSISRSMALTPLWERLSKTLKGPSKIDDGTLMKLRQIAKSYWGLRTNISYRDLLGMLLGHLKTLYQLLQDPQSTLVYQQLYSIVSENAQFVGAIYFDMGDHTNAFAYYKVSIAAAKEAKDYTLWITGLGRMSSLPIYGDNPRTALPLLRQAQKLANEQGIATLLAWLYALQAEAFSNLQEKRECLQALSQAERFIERIKPDDRGEINFDYARFVGYKGTCYLHLHQPEAALAALEEINTQPSLLSLRQHSIIVADMAAAYIQKKEIEEACICATQALESTNWTKSSLVLKRLHSVHQVMKPWKLLSCVSDFEKQMILNMYTSV